MQTTSTPPGEFGRLDLSRIAQDLQIRKIQVESVVQLLDEGNTIPFITRYRKERTGGLDEEVLRVIQERVGLLRQLAERRLTVLKSIENQGKLTDELRAAILAADNPKRLEDLYLPYKPKKRTLATAAREKGLEPLATAIWNADPAVANLAELLPTLVNPEKELATPDDVLAGAQHILAELIAESADVRGVVRAVLWDTGVLTTSKSEKLAEGQGQEYKDYFQFKEPIRHIPPHRVLAINRGEKENALTVKLEWDSETGRRVALERLPLPLPGEQPPPAPTQPGSPTDAPAAEAPPPAADAAGSPAPEAPAAEAPPAEAPPQTESPAAEAPHHPPPHRNPQALWAARTEALHNHPHADFLRTTTEDALARLLAPSLEREIRRELTQRSEGHAVEVFARNLRGKLLAPPLRGRRVLAVDPGFRTGCKLAVLDETGNLAEDGVIYPHTPPAPRRAEAKVRLEELVRKHQIQVIAIGNGTACRETEEVVSELIADLDARRHGGAPEAAAPIAPTEALRLRPRWKPPPRRKPRPLRRRKPRRPRRIRGLTPPARRPPTRQPRRSSPRLPPTAPRRPRRPNRRRLPRHRRIPSPVCRTPRPSWPMSSSTRPAPASTRPAPSAARSSPTSTPRSAAPSPSAAVSRTRSASWSRSTRSTSASAFTSTTSARASSANRSTASSSRASTPSAWT